MVYFDMQYRLHSYCLFIKNWLVLMDTLLICGNNMTKRGLFIISMHYRL